MRELDAETLKIAIPATCIVCAGAAIVGVALRLTEEGASNEYLAIAGCAVGFGGAAMGGLAFLLRARELGKMGFVDRVLAPLRKLRLRSLAEEPRPEDNPFYRGALEENARTSHKTAKIDPDISRYTLP